MDEQPVASVSSRRRFLGSLAILAGTSGCLRMSDDESSATGQQTTETTALATDTATETATEQEPTDAETTTQESMEAWPTVGANNAGTGTAEVTPPAGELTELWSVDLESNVGTPVVANETVYAAGESDIRALEAATGEERWRYGVGRSQGSPPTVAEEVVYASPGDGFLYAIEAGEFVWSTSVSDVGMATRYGSPRVHDDTVVAQDKYIVGGYDRATGDERWRHSLQNYITGIAVRDGTAFVAAAAGGKAVSAFDVQSGERRWTYDGLNGSHAPTVVDGTVYGGSHYYMFALDAASGEREWKAEVNGVAPASPAIADGSIYALEESGDLFEAATDSGEIRWRTSLWDAPTNGVPGISGPALVDGTLYVGTRDGRALAVNADDGAVERTFDLGAESRCPPAIAEGRLYISTIDGTLFALGSR